MKEENKKEIKKGILTGAGTTIGAVIGAVVENTINAADIGDNDLAEAEVVNAVVEELPEVQEEAGGDSEVAPEPVEANVLEPQTHIHQSVAKPAKNNGEESQANDSDSQDDTETVVEVEGVVITESETEPVIVEEPEVDEDITVVSVESDDSVDEASDIYDPDAVCPDADDMVLDGIDGPDYVDMKDNDLNVGSSMMSAVDMPDYVNDANIDSFTDNV